MSKLDRLPNDADGDTIRRIQASGSSLDQPMDIDIQIVASSEEAAQDAHTRLAVAGFSVRRFFHDDSNDWDVIATKTMLLTHRGIVQLQADVSELLSDLSCVVDGWGTLGNSK